MPRPSALLARHGLAAEVPPDWRAAADPLRFLDSTVLRFWTADGLVLYLERTRRAGEDLVRQLRLARESYARALPGASWKDVTGQLGPWPARGFDGEARRGALRLKVFYRVARAGEGLLSVQGQAPASVWARREAEVERFMQSLRLREEGAPGAGPKP